MAKLISDRRSNIILSYFNYISSIGVPSSKILYPLKACNLPGSELCITRPGRALTLHAWELWLVYKLRLATMSLQASLACSYPPNYVFQSKSDKIEMYLYSKIRKSKCLIFSNINFAQCAQACAQMYSRTVLKDQSNQRCQESRSNPHSPGRKCKNCLPVYAPCIKGWNP